MRRGEMNPDSHPYPLSAPAAQPLCSHPLSAPCAHPYYPLPPPTIRPLSSFTHILYLHPPSDPCLRQVVKVMHPLSAPCAHPYPSSPPCLGQVVKVMHGIQLCSASIRVLWARLFPEDSHDNGGDEENAEEVAKPPNESLYKGRPLN